MLLGMEWVVEMGAGEGEVRGKEARFRVSGAKYSLKLGISYHLTLTFLFSL